MENSVISYSIIRRLRSILMFCGVMFFLSYVALALMRLNYPYELEWMEGGMVDIVRRILEGRKIYVAPTLQFVPFVYTPLFYYLSAILSAAIGVGFLPLRILSFLASLGCFIVIFRFVGRETEGDGFASMTAVFLFAATYGATGAWFDIGRTDMLFLLFLLVGMYHIRFGESLKSYLVAGIFFFLSFLTKQTALIVAVPMAVFSVYKNRRGGALFAGAVFGLIAASSLFFDWLHEGWYSYYVFDVPGSHALIPQRILEFWIKDMAPVLIALMVSTGQIFFLIKGRRKLETAFYLTFYIGMVGAAWLSRMHSGGAANVLIPAFAAFSVLSGVALHAAFAVNGWQRSHQAGLLLLCILQFLLLLYNPLSLAPKQETRTAGQEFVRVLSEINGDVFVPYHGYLPILAGKQTHAHAMGLYDIWGGADEKTKAVLREELRRAARERHFAAIVVDSGQFLKDWFTEEDFAAYDMVQCSAPAREYAAITGMKASPQIMLIPCRTQK